MDEEIEKRLEALKMRLPTVAAPIGAYLPAVRAHGFLFVSGQLPWDGGQLAARGKLGADVSLDEGIRAARMAALNGLAQVKEALGGRFRGLDACIKVTGFVNAAMDFTEHPKVIDGASAFLLAVLGDKGRHARSAIGVSSLPLNAAVEIDFVFAIS